MWPPCTPYLSQEHFKKLQETIHRLMRFYISSKSGLSTCWTFSKRQAPKDDEESSNKILDILHMGSISTRRHEWHFGSMVPIYTRKHEMEFW